MQEELNNFKLITNKNEVKLEVLSSDDDDDENDEFDDDLNKNNDNEEESETAMEIDDSKTSEINEGNHCFKYALTYNKFYNLNIFFFRWRWRRWI